MDHLLSWASYLAALVWGLFAGALNYGSAVSTIFLIGPTLVLIFVILWFFLQPPR